MANRRKTMHAEVTGLAPTRSAHEVWPDVPILLCSGHAEAVSKDDLKVARISSFLTKPVMGRDLVLAVEDVLASTVEPCASSGSRQAS